MSLKHRRATLAATILYPAITIIIGQGFDGHPEFEWVKVWYATITKRKQCQLIRAWMVLGSGARSDPTCDQIDNKSFLCYTQLYKIFSRDLRGDFMLKIGINTTYIYGVRVWKSIPRLEVHMLAHPLPHHAPHIHTDGNLITLRITCALRKNLVTMNPPHISYATNKDFE